MGERGRAHVTTTYSTSQTANETLALYKWLCNLGPLPASVTLSNQQVNTCGTL